MTNNNQNHNTGKAESESRLRVSGRDLAYCLQCSTCNTCCPVRNFDKNFNPREMVHQASTGTGGAERQPETLYRCLLCSLCQEVCPLGLKLDELMLALRQQLVEEGRGPLPQHQLVRRNQEWSTSDAVTLAQPDPQTGECHYAFFPGCALSGYSPELVIQVYNYLREKLPGTGIILGCCGSPTHFLGDQSRFGDIIGWVEAEMNRLGASELLVACPDCYHTIKHNAPHIKLRSIYEVMVEKGLPETASAATNKVFSLHDSCKARGEKDWQESVRTLIKEMGYEIEEMEYSGDKTRCCGMGGMIPYVDFELANNITKQRVDEASHDIVTYCAACREAFAAHKPCIHLLDLIFNPNWEEDSVKEPKTGKERRENQARVKTLVQEKLLV